MPRNSDEETLAHSSQERNHVLADSGEKGERVGNMRDKRAPENKPPVGFWHRDLNQVRSFVIRRFIITTLILSTGILGILSLYWGVLFHVERNLSSLVVYIVDFDAQIEPYTNTTPIIGPFVTEEAKSLIAPSNSLGWGSLPASQFNNDPLEVRRAVYHEKAWAAIIINPNATALLQEAVMNGNSSYDPMGAIQVVYIEARDETTYASYILPQLSSFQSQIISSFGKIWAGQVLQVSSTSPNILTNIQSTPQAISPGIGFSIYNLRPFYPAVTTPAITIGLIYLIIISFFSYSFYLPLHMKFIHSPGHPPLLFNQLIIWRWFATISAYFFLSLFYSLISLAFQIPFSTGAQSEVEVANPATAYGMGTFPVYWMLNWVGMIALGLACENMAVIVGQPWTAFWLIFWVITNVSTSFYSITLAPRFYYWGYAWPLHNIVSASRTLLFNTHSRIGLNFGILFAWVAVNTVLFPICCYYMRFMEVRAERKKEQGKGN